MDKDFILTNSSKTAKILINEGYTKISEDGSHWIFINNGNKITFSSLEDVIFTNKIFI